MRRCAPAPASATRPMPQTFKRLLALPLLLAATTSLLAQFPQPQTPRPKFRFAPGPKEGGGDIKWSAAGPVVGEKDEYLILERDVKIEYQDIKLAADKVTYNPRTKDVVAEGHVTIDQGPTRITGSQAFYNLTSKTGTFFNSTATMDPTMYFGGDKIEKIDDDTYRLTNGVFTSCDLDNPAWSIRVGSADVTLDDYARMKDVSFRANGLPIFWAPRLTWPTKRDRSRGFLIPRILQSSRFGERLELGYYVPFGESADATMFAELNTKQYFGAGINVRYLPSQNVKIGELTAYTVTNPEPELNDPGTTDSSRQEWRYQYRHAQENLPGGFRGVVDVQDYSNLDFFRDYDRESRFQTLSNIYSSAYLTRNRSTYSLNILAERRDQVYLSQRQRFEQLPSLQYRMYPQRIASTPFYFSMESSASHLRTSGVDAAGAITPGADYNRADIFPTVSMQLRTPPWLSVRPQVSLRETWYTGALDPITQQPNNGESISRFYAQGQVEVIGPSFSRVFNRTIGTFSRFKHVIEPRFSYVYTTNVKDQNRIIRFDTVDSPYLPLVQDSVEYSLTQRLLGKEKGPNGNSREVLSFSLRQSVALSEPFEQRSITGSPIPVDDSQRFTPLVASLHINPFQTITLDANATFGNVSHQLDQTSLSANVVGSGAWSDKYLNFTWFTTFRDPRIPAAQEANDSSQVRINTGSEILKDRLRADVQLNFDAKNGRFLEQRFLLGGTGSCYGIAVEYRNYSSFGFDQRSGTFSERQIASYGISVTLKNVGTIGTH